MPHIPEAAIEAALKAYEQAVDIRTGIVFPHEKAVRAALAAALPHLGSGEAQGDLTALRKANVERQAIWCPDEVPDLSFRGNELGGETGEALNVIKKLERERLGWRGSRDTKEHLAEELADVVICADLCAITAGIDLASAVVNKFNATSDKVGIPVKLHPAPPSSGLMEEVKALRQIISECAEACGAGIAPTASIEFMAKLPDEIRLSAKLKDATP